VSWSAISGGPMGTPSQQPTISGAGWTSFYTGTWTDRHGVINNSSPAYDHPLAVSSYQSKKAPPFAVHLKERVASASVASIVSWGWIEDYLIPAAPTAFSFHEKGIGANYADRDASVCDKTQAYLAANDPDVLMLHFDQVDGAGHASGFSADNPDYLKALAKVDEHLGAVMATIRARADYANEQWMTVVSTDHGGLGTKHGGQSADERDIFMIAHGPGVEAGKVSTRAVGQPALAPTIFRYFDVAIAPDWHWAEEPFGLSAPE
jgi:hypothetical protein